MNTEQMKLDFFNTTNESGQLLRDSLEKSQKQGERVLHIFRMYDCRAMTPATVHAVYENIYSKTPITSIRRAMTDLTTKGYLIKTNEKALGCFGANNYKWRMLK
jgi:hypothetical protein